MSNIASFLVLAVTFYAYCEGTVDARKNHLWINEEKLGQFQNAWQAITADFEKIYYLVNATYESNDMWGEHFRCVRMKGRVVDRSKNVMNVDSFYNNRQRSRISRPWWGQELSPIRLFNYSSVPNGIKYETADECIELAVVFTDGETCHVIYVPNVSNKRTNETIDGYQLWVNEKHLQKQTVLCTYVFNALSEKRKIYQIYTSEQCWY